MKQGFLQKFAREAIYLLAGLFIATLSIVGMMMLSRHVLGNFSSLQNSSITGRCERVLQAFSQESDHLLSMLSEYSYWDKTYDFEKGRNPDYIEEEFALSTMDFGRINNMILFNQKGKYIGGASLVDGDIAFKVPSEIYSEFERNEAFLHPAMISQGHVGFMEMNGEFYLFACRSVSNTDLDAPVAGSLVFGRLLDELELQRLSVLVGATIKVRKATGNELLNPWHMEHSSLMEGSLITFDDPLHSANNFHANILVKDITGAHTIAISVEFPAEITAMIRQAVHLIDWWMIGTVSVSFIFAIILIAEMSRRRSQLQRQIQAAEDLERAKLHAESLAEQATAADKAKSQFLAIMSHEVRTPLNAVIGFSNLLNDSILSATQREQINIIRSSGEILLRVINDILDFSKIEAGKLELDNAVCRLDEITEEVREVFQLAAKNKNLNFTVSGAPDVPQRIFCDQTRLLQVLGNLISNAIKFTHSGGVSLRIERVEMDDPMEGKKATGSEKEISIRFIVNDTGIGISDEAKGRLFQAFSQGDSTMSRKYGGTGLGLVISRKLCQMMGGDIHVQSKAGEGSEFAFVIRTTEVVGDAPPSSNEPGRTSAPLVKANPSFHGLRTLLVEDNMTNRKLMLSVLGRMGVEAEHAEDGVQALTKVKEKRFDVIFMDLQMPEMDGFTCTEKIREHEVQTGRRPCHIVALTAAAFPEDMKKCLAVGMDAFLSKPIKIEELQRILEKLANGA